MTTVRPENLACSLRDSAADAELFGNVYDALVVPVLRFFLRRVDQHDVAADLVSETFALALERRRQFKGRTDREVAAWVFTIAKRQLADFHRRGAASKSAMQRLRMERPPVTDGEFDDLFAVEDAVGSLPVSGREAVTLRYREDLSYAEIAELLKINEATARARVSRSVGRLRKALGGVSNA
ncbi:MAG: RNA polymerase sigma factor [Actinobacteria bacterium]|nr:RNA polymerase sigma factor [Actinomycetota bacterium]